MFEYYVHTSCVFFIFTSKDATTSFLRKFESRVAQTFGKDDAVFMPSGVMAQR